MLFCCKVFPDTFRESEILLKGWIWGQVSVWQAPRLNGINWRLSVNVKLASREMKIGWFVCVLNSLPGRMRKMPWASTLNKPLTRGGSRNSGVDPALSKSKSATMWTTCYQPAWGLQGWFRLISLKLRFDFSFCFQSSCFVFLVCDFTLVCLDNDVNFFSFFFLPFLSGNDKAQTTLYIWDC